MADTFPARISRRTVVAATMAALPLGAASRAAAARAKVVTVLGDSITAGYGLSASAALPAQLQQALQALGVASVVRGAGVSGDTSANGAARMDFSIRADTSAVVVALGGNDLLQGIDPKVTRRNLDRILTRLKQRGFGVVLAGLHAPPELGRGYARDFDAVYSGLAKAHRIAFYPDLLAGVGRNPALNQADGIHPNAQGVQIIARSLAPTVARVLAKQP